MAREAGQTVQTYFSLPLAPPTGNKAKYGWLARLQFILHVCVVMTVVLLGVLALGLLSVNLTYTVLNAAVLSSTCGMRTKQDHSR